MAFETGDVLEPELAVLLDPSRDFFEALGLELVDALASFLSFADEPCAPEDLEVLRDCGSADAESRSELGYRSAALSKAVEDRSPSGIGDRIEDVGMGLGSGHRQ